MSLNEERGVENRPVRRVGCAGRARGCPGSAMASVAVFLDYNGDGRPNLYIAKRRGSQQLYENVAVARRNEGDPAGLGFRVGSGSAEGVAISTAWAWRGRLRGGRPDGQFVTLAARAVGSIRDGLVRLPSVRQMARPASTGGRHRASPGGARHGRFSRIGVAHSALQRARPGQNLKADASRYGLLAPLSGPRRRGD